MGLQIDRSNRKQMDLLFIGLLAVITAILFMLPIGVKSGSTKGENVRVRVLEVDNTNVEQYGLVKTGNQSVFVEILSGAHKGEQLKGANLLVGKLELDTIYTEGNKALGVVYTDTEGNPRTVTIVGLYRVNAEIALLGVFILFLFLFAGRIGVKAVISFAFSGVMILKVMLPLFLLGIDPFLVALAVVLILSAVILFLVGDFSRKGLAAFLGTFSGVLITCIMAIIFGRAFHISGAVKPFSETLLYSGYAHLNLTRIFLSSIFIAASGALMDISMDVASAMEEVQYHHPRISRGKLILSGFRVGRSVVGTMTTTLLLAYSSNYMALLMVFMAQGTPGIQILNLSYVAAEFLNTIVGSFGLVATAPLTALVAGFLYTEKKPGPHESRP